MMGTLGDALRAKRNDIRKSFSVQIDVGEDGSLHVGEPEDVVMNADPVPPQETSNRLGEQHLRVEPDGTVEGSDLAPNPRTDNMNEVIPGEEMADIAALEEIAAPEPSPGMEPRGLRQRAAANARERLNSEKNKGKSKKGFK